MNDPKATEDIEGMKHEAEQQMESLVEEDDSWKASTKPHPDKLRAGYTTNKGRGTSKARRKMAKASRRRNRK